MQDAQQWKDQGADVRGNGGREQEGLTSYGMAGRHRRMGQGVTPGAEPSSNGQKELEEFGEDGHQTPMGAEPMVLDDDDDYY